MFLPDGYLSFQEATALIPDQIAAGYSKEKSMLLGGILASGEMQAEGVIVADDHGQEDHPEVGKFVQIRPETWRHPRALQAMTGDDASNRLWQGGFLLTPVIPRKALYSWLKALNLVVEALNRPPAPAEAREMHEPPATPSEVLCAWFNGYANGFKDCGSLVKRDAAIARARDLRGCTVREAEAAFEALPYPELRNPPRTPEAFARVNGSRSKEGPEADAV